MVHPLVAYFAATCGGVQYGKTIPRHARVYLFFYLRLLEDERLVGLFCLGSFPDVVAARLVRPEVV